MYISPEVILSHVSQTSRGFSTLATAALKKKKHQDHKKVVILLTRRLTIGVDWLERMYRWLHDWCAVHDWIIHLTKTDGRGLSKMK